eukprot:GHVP01039155.1.p1 GENE.GHVP01039155.1~~GHVP01039155.1.p1  ORF type:complete len:125 (-),score=10.03 GHVP01039155.1:117-491(-)
MCLRPNKNVLVYPEFEHPDLITGATSGHLFIHTKRGVEFHEKRFKLEFYGLKYEVIQFVKGKNNFIFRTLPNYSNVFYKMEDSEANKIQLGTWSLYEFRSPLPSDRSYGYVEPGKQLPNEIFQS